MTSKRPVILMAILLVLLGAVAAPNLRDAYDTYVHRDTATVQEPAVLPGANSISNLSVQQQPDGRWMVSFDYFYTGAPKFATVEIYQVVAGAMGGDHLSQAGTPKRGAHRYTTIITHPRSWEMALTTRVYAVMRVATPARTQLARMDLGKV